MQYNFLARFGILTPSSTLELVRRREEYGEDYEAYKAAKSAHLRFCSLYGAEGVDLEQYTKEYYGRRLKFLKGRS